MSARPATKGITKAKRTKPTKPRGRRTSQQEMNPALASVSFAAQDGAADAMDLTPADSVLESIDSAVFEYEHPHLLGKSLADWLQDSGAED